MYEKTDWKIQKGTGLNRFAESERVDNTVVLTPAPDEITEPGTPFSVENMNKIEQGIFAAHDLLDKFIHIGKIIKQLPNELSPAEQGLPGRWEICNYRASRYKLRPTANPAFTTYTPGANYAAGAIVMWHLAGDDWNIFQAKEALTNVPAQLDPIKWTEVAHANEEIIDQRHLHAYTDEDFVIGHQITLGEYTGWYVSAIYVYGGKYMAASGGNRPPFNSGTAGDAIRKILGRIDASSELYGISFYPGQTYGAFFSGQVNNNTFSTLNQYAVPGNRYANFDTSLVVPTALENQVRTIPVLYWRLISLQ